MKGIAATCPSGIGSAKGLIVDSGVHTADYAAQDTDYPGP